MNDSITQFLLHAPSRRWFSSPLHRHSTPTDQPLPWRAVFAHALYIACLVGLSLGVIVRFGAGRWYAAPFILPGAYGFLIGFLWATLVRVAWNRRADALRRLANAGQRVSEPVPLQGVRRLLPAVFVLLFFTIALALCVSLENFRGSLALRSFHNDLLARGEPIRLEEIIPPPIPDEQNLAAIPLLKPLLEYSEGPDGLRPADTNGQARAKGIRTEVSKPTFMAFASQQGRKESNYAKGQRTDLALWQAYYWSLTNSLPHPLSPTLSPGQTVLEVIDRHSAELRELREGAQSRPFARFPVRYDQLSTMPLDHLGALKTIALTLSLRASALLAENQPEEALDDILLAQRLADSIRDEPVLISQLVRMSIASATLQPVWEGCLDHRWTAETLMRLQQMLATRDSFESIKTGLRGERVLVSTDADRIARNGIPPEAGGPLDSAEYRMILRWMPRGWIRLGQVAHGRYVLAINEALSTARNHTDLPPKGTLLARYIDPKSAFTILAALSAPGLADNSLDRAFEQETWRRLALVGLALERYRLAEGQYPEQLSALAPGYLESIPSDIMDGQPLRYSRIDAGDFHLYSVGKNHRDDGALRPPRKPAGAAKNKEYPGDWIWR